jgi:predicted CoA-binding protein
MAHDNLTDDEVRTILKATTRIAVVGASNKPDRPSYGVIGALVAAGYEVVPVNPGLAGQQIHGRTVAASLADAGALDMVDIFRAPDAVAPVVDEAVRLGARTIWMQLGIVNQDAAEVARAAGLQVVMDRCPKIELPRLGL